MSDKLYKVTLRGMTYASCGGTIYGIAYVVASDPAQAYAQVRESLKQEKVGYDRDREMDRVELIAESANHPHCQVRLYRAVEQ